MQTIKRSLVATILAGLIVAGAGCSSSDDVVTVQNAEGLQDCGLAALLQLFSAVERLGEVLDEIAGNDRDGVSVTPTGTANEFDFTVALDLDGDGSTETTVSGRLTFDQDPSAGVMNGDTATLVLNQPSSIEVSNVSGTLDLTFLDSGAAITGMASVNGILGCNVSIDLPESDPLNLQFGGALPAQLAVNFANFLELSGTAALAITSGSSRLQTTVMFSASSQTISFSQTTFNEVVLPDENIEAPLSGDEFSDLQECLVAGVFGTVSVAFAVESVIEAVAAGRTDTTFDDDAFTFTNVSGFTYDISLVSMEGSQEATITARVTFSSDPTVTDFTGTADIASWTLRFRQGTQLSGLAPVLGDADGNSTGPARATFDAGAVESFWGSGTVAALDGSCSSTTNIPSTNPIFVEATPPSSVGRIEVDLTVDGVPFSATVALVGATEEILVIDAVYDGIPIPGNLLEESLFLVFFF